MTTEEAGAGCSLAFDADRPIARLTLTRPAVHNAFDDSLVAGLTAALADLRGRIEADEADSPRVLILTGEGKSFSAGADLGWMQRQKSATVDENHAGAAAMAAMFEALDTLPCATLARVNGAAIGGGTGLVAACDIAVAADSAVFAFSEVRLGLIPAVISPFVIRRIGPGHARDWMLTGGRFGGPEAKRIGLVHESVPAADLDAAVEARVRRLLLAGPRAIRACKELIAEVGSHRSDSASLHRETAARIAAIRVSPEGQEGISAFLDKRAPGFAIAPPKPDGPTRAQ